ncbi:uncharacterized protein FIBRA_01837 [Fibroporia radiculosa]|uniref:Uncharacterized protein n=1 Tax=Fibroporia radiculosa TaxID=599839 RepID=J4G175_9APHY|nr:uncharacterized protein FIBRA_01837 [Fibroporia radiculosa]CCL99813.1 predicted protein [Fibroporia radiculosa]
MSSTNSNTNPFVTQPPPEHHVHRDSEVLPGAKRGGQAPDYSADVTNDSKTWADNNQRRFGAGTDDHMVMAGGQHDTLGTRSTPDGQQGNNAYTQDRPMDVKPTSQGGVAVGGHDDLPEGKAKLTDKIIGKAQKVAGKATNNQDLHEKGELREAGGKAAVQGEARVSHD